MFGPGVGIYAATHEVEVQSRRDNVEYAKPVSIGPDCWIGANAVILPGVTIGKGISAQVFGIYIRAALMNLQAARSVRPLWSPKTFPIGLSRWAPQPE